MQGGIALESSTAQGTDASVPIGFDCACTTGICMRNQMVTRLRNQCVTADAVVENAEGSRKNTWQTNFGGAQGGSRVNASSGTRFHTVVDSCECYLDTRTNFLQRLGWHCQEVAIDRLFATYSWMPFSACRRELWDKLRMITTEGV